MAAAGIEIKGLDELNRYLQRLVVGTPAEAGKLLFREAKTIMTASMELVPVNTGALRGSAQVQEPVVEGSRVSVTMGYGGAAAGNKAKGEVGYAIPVHENLTAHHPNGQAKYLERAVLEAIPALKQTLAADFAEIFKGVK